MKSRSLVLSVLLVTLLIAAVDGQVGGKVGGWQQIKDLNDPHVREIAEFAVSEYNKQSKANLKLEKIIRGESQVVAGTNYRLVLSAKDAHATRSYVAVVYERPWEKYKKLTSFEPVSKKI